MTNTSTGHASESAKSGAPMRAPNGLALEVSGLSHFYGSHKALDSVTFSIKLKEFVILLGLNGAGKSTLFSLITRLFDAQEGEIRIFGHELRRDPSAALRLLGVVFQARTLDLELSVAQNLYYHAALHGISRLEARARASEVLQRVRMQGHANDTARDLSGGQMRRVEIARSLIHNPRLLLLDEPTVGLDIEARGDILRHVRRLVAENGISALWATHLIDEAADCDRVIILHSGKIIAQGKAGDLVKEAGAQNLHDAFTILTRQHQHSKSSGTGGEIEAG
jgi:ABC-2 type transport system ATP-binding protein